MTIIYKVDTGEIVCASEHPMSQEAIDMMLLPGGLAAIDGFCQSDDAYVRHGELVIKPPSPGENYVFNLSTGEWELSTEMLIMEVLGKRQLLLLQSDWTQLPDVPLETKEAWAVYRQELRDITTQPGYPNDIIWPVPPA